MWLRGNYHEDHIFPFGILGNFINANGKSQESWYDDDPKRQDNPLIFVIVERS